MNIAACPEDSLRLTRAFPAVWLLLPCLQTSLPSEDSLRESPGLFELWHCIVEVISDPKANSFNVFGIWVARNHALLCPQECATIETQSIAGVRERRMRLLVVAIMVLLGTSIAYADPPRGYYESAANKSGSELKAALHALVDDHDVLPYTQSGNTDWFDGQNIDVWEALVYTDSACADSVPNCGLVRLLYLDESRHISKANRGSGKNDLWEREHVWPKSRGFKNEAQDGYTDLHHLRPADRNLNSKHSNYGYDVGGVAVMDKLADDSEVPTSAKFDMINASFEPTDQAKGQIARMIFYMAVRYEVGDDGGAEKMPDLVLKDENSRVKEPWIGDLCTLMNWNNAFGPTDFERRRNDRVMELQGNRNPFIDEPGWANLIWGDQCG